MANPRDVTSRIGTQPKATLTFEHDNTIVYSDQHPGGSASVGLAVTLDDDGICSLVGDGEGVLGKLLIVESDGYCVVQVEGVMELPRGTSATLTQQKAIVGDLLVGAEGYIRDVATGTAAELGVARGFVIDATASADGAMVEVRL